MQHVLNLLGVFCVIDNLILKIILTVLTERIHNFISFNSFNTDASELRRKCAMSQSRKKAEFPRYLILQ